MSLLRVWVLRLRGAFGSRRHDVELNDELEALVSFHTDDYVRAGLPHEEARRQALIRIGGLPSVTQAYRDQHGVPLLETTWQDVRFGTRMLLRHRAYSAVAVLTLALGIGASTTTFSIVDAVLLRPFAFPQPERLVMMWEINAARGIRTFTTSVPNYVDWKASATRFSDLGAWEPRHTNRTDVAVPERLQGAAASAPLFRALGITPQLGRFFADEEDTPAGRLVVVLGDDYWRRSFGGDPSVLGRTMVLNGESHTIIGVMPPLRAPFKVDVWQPLAADVPALDRGSHAAFVVGRLNPGETRERAEAELQAVAARLADAYPESNRGWSVRAESLYDALVPERTRRSMWMLLGAVGLLLLIACVNVASLTLARATTRVREFSTRFALGAGRTQLMRQLFTECALLAIASALLGLLAAAWLLDVVQQIFPADVRGLAEARLNPIAGAFAAAVASVTAIVFGLLPAYHVSRQASAAQWLSTRAVTASPRLRAVRHGFVAAQVALAVVLLVGSGLLLVSVNRLLRVPLGFGAGRVVTARVTLTERRYDDQVAYIRFVDRLLGELQSRPGVVAAGVSSSVPLDGEYTAMQVRREADRFQPTAEGLLSQWRVIGGDYLAALDIPLVAGRRFTDADAMGLRPRATIISETLAHQLFADQDPVGRHIVVGDARQPYRVVGVVGAARLTALDARPEPAMYFHFRQFGWPSLAVVVRSAGNADTLAGAIRSSVAAADPMLPVMDERPMQGVVALAAATPRMNAALLSTFGVLALTLATIGVYGTMNYATATRTGEMSLRLVLGARPASVFLLILQGGVQLSAIGVALGVAVAASAAGSIGRLLFDVSAHEPWVYAVAAVFVFGVAIVACCIPARRAMHADPRYMLRQE